MSDFYKRSTKKDKRFMASFEILKIIAKAGKPHNIDERIILLVVSVVI